MLKIILPLCALCAVLPLDAQNLEEFSNLSGINAFSPNFSSIATEDGLIYAINSQSRSSMMLYKIGSDGSIVKEYAVDDCCDYAYHGDLFNSEGRYFFSGYRSSVTAPAHHLLLEINGDLDIILQQTWPGLSPDNASFVGSIISSGINAFTRGARRVSGDTLFAIVPYAKSSSLLPETRYEVLGLNGEVYLTRDMKDIDSLFSYKYFTMGEDAFYIFGGMAGEPLPGTEDFSVGQNVGPIGKYRLSDGQIQGVSWFSDPVLGNSVLGSMGQYHEGKVYCSAISEGPLQQAPYAGSGCLEEDGGTVIEVRNKDLQFIRGLNLPCGFKVNGGKAFAFGDDGHIYYANANSESGTTSIFKFDSLLNTVWVQNYSIAFPHSILLDADNNLVVNTIDNLFFRPTLRIYRVNTEGGGIVNTTSLPLPSPPPTFHPNPFTNELSLLAPPERPLRVDVFGMDGRAHGSHRAQDGRLQLGHLPGGAYVLRLSDVESGAFIGAQQVVKVGSR